MITNKNFSNVKRGITFSLLVFAAVSAHAMARRSSDFQYERTQHFSNQGHYEMPWQSMKKE